MTGRGSFRLASDVFGLGQARDTSRLTDSLLSFAFPITRPPSRAMDEEASVAARFKRSEEEKARRICELKARFEAATPGKRKGRASIAHQAPKAKVSLIALLIAAGLALTAGGLLLFT
jgi:hypothetical protein